MGFEHRLLVPSYEVFPKGGYGVDAISVIGVFVPLIGSLQGERNHGFKLPRFIYKHSL